MLEAYRKAEAHAVQLPFLGIASVLVVLAVVFWLLRRSPAAPSSASEVGGGFNFALLKRPRLALGAVSIFVYVGAEVSIGRTVARGSRSIGSSSSMRTGEGTPASWASSWAKRPPPPRLMPPRSSPRKESRKPRPRARKK